MKLNIIKMAILNFVHLHVNTLYLGKFFLQVLEFTFQKMVFLIGVSYSRIQIFKVIYAEAVVITL